MGSGVRRAILHDEIAPSSSRTDDWQGSEINVRIFGSIEEKCSLEKAGLQVD